MEKNFFEKPKNPENLDFYVPTLEDLETKDYKFLCEKLAENHNKILPKIIEGNYPFFALHGTNSENTKSLLKAKGEHRLELATFYEKEKNEFFLYKLYAMARYVTAYALKNQKDLSKFDLKGNILVFNVEKNDKNSTHKWEHLFPGLDGFGVLLGGDSSKEKKYREDLSNRDNLPYRTDEYFDIQKELSSGSLNVIPLEDFQQLADKFERGSKDLGYKILQGRFRDQEIVSRILKIFEK